MSYISSLIKNVKEFYSEINGATLTGAIDVVVVEQEDGTFKSSPFHVRFGKMGVLKAKEKIVDLEINGHPVNINMKLDDTGAAFFVEELEGEDDCWPSDLATSPLPDLGKHLDWRERRSKSFKPSSLFLSETDNSLDSQKEDVKAVLEEQEEDQEDEEDEDVPDTPNIEESSGRKGKLNKKKRRRRTQLRASRRGSKTNVLAKENETTNEFNEDDMFAMDDVTDISKEKHESPDRLEPLQAIFLEEPVEGVTRGRTLSDPSGLQSMILDIQDDDIGIRPETAPVPVITIPGDDLDSDDVQWRWGELPVSEGKLQEYTPTIKEDPKPTEETKEIKKEEEESKSSWLQIFRSSKSSRKSEERVDGVYLDDMDDMDPEKRAVYLQPYKDGPLEVCVDNQDPLDIMDRDEVVMDIPRTGMDMPRDDDCESGNGPSPPMSPPSGFMPKQQGDIANIVSKHLPDLAVSLCGGLSDRSITPTRFQDTLLTYPQFLEKLKEPNGLLSEPDLVVRLCEKYVSWSQASPILISLMFFKKPLPIYIVDSILKDGLPVNLNLTVEEAIEEQNERKGSSWFNNWFGSSNDQEKIGENVKENAVVTDVQVEKEDETEKKEGPKQFILGTPKKRRDTETSSSESETGTGKRIYRKAMRLTSDQLASLNLEKGSNEVEFSVTTAFQGTTRCRCHIYLWHHTDKVVISDIDGTITKSDIMGHLLPMVGKDWAQSGVTQLFTKIRANGYHIMYLSARAIGQASMTKDYLESLRQGEVCLPDGPVFLNPDSLIHAFKREVIDKNPEEFKIRCMKDIQMLFEDRNPFFAGYGNKPNDAYAYRAVGIPVSRIFTINPAGELKHELTQNFQTSYETQSLEVDYYFPSLEAAQQIREIVSRNVRKQSIYFDVSDFEPIERKLETRDTENFFDFEDKTSRNGFRVRSGTDVSDMLTSFKHRQSLRKNSNTRNHFLNQVSINLDLDKINIRDPLNDGFDGINIRDPVSRCPSLDMTVFQGDENSEIHTRRNSNELEQRTRRN